MSQYGSISFFTEQPNPDPARLLRSVIGIFNPRSVDFIRREDEWQEWDQIQAYRNSPDNPLPPRSESLSKCPVDQVQSLYQSGRVLSVTFGESSPLGHAIYEAHLSLSESVRGNFSPWDLGMTVGWHDLFDPEEIQTPAYFGRALLSVSLAGQGSPANWEEYRRRVWHLPAVVDAIQRLDPLLAPLNTCAYWQT